MIRAVLSNSARWLSVKFYRYLFWLLVPLCLSVWLANIIMFANFAISYQTIQFFKKIRTLWFLSYNLTPPSRNLFLVGTLSMNNINVMFNHPKTSDLFQRQYISYFSHRRPFHVYTCLVLHERKRMKRTFHKHYCFLFTCKKQKNINKYTSSFSPKFCTPSTLQTYIFGVTQENIES